MKVFEWDSEKNDWLRKVRGVTVDEVVFHIATGGLLDTVRHPDPERYPDQRILVVDIEGYAYMVPFLESNDTVFLKTIIPSRKMTKRYLEKERP